MPPVLAGFSLIREIATPSFILLFLAAISDEHLWQPQPAGLARQPRHVQARPRRRVRHAALSQTHLRRRRRQPPAQRGRGQARLAPLGTVHGGRLRDEQLQGGQIVLEFRFSNKCDFLQRNLHGALSTLGLGLG